MSGPKVLIWKNKIWEATGSNLGDLAIITATIDALRSAVPDVEVVLLSDDPDHTSELYGVTAKRFSPGELRRTVREADLVVLGGGTLFTDATAGAVAVNVSAAYLAGRHTPVVGYGVASGPMTALGRSLVRGALRRMRFVCVRDVQTAMELEALLPDVRERIHVTEDVAFSLRVPEPRPARVNRVVISPRRIFHYANTWLPFAVRKRLGMLPRGLPAKMEQFKDMLARVADHVFEEHGSEIVFLPMYSGIGGGEGVAGYAKTTFSSRDDLVCAEVRSRMRHAHAARVELTDRPLQALSLLAGSRLLVGVPLHSLILAHVAETPFVGLSYQGKVDRFMRHANMERFTVHVESMACPLDLADLTAKVDAALAEEDSLRDRMRAGNEKMRETVDTPARMIAELLAGRDPLAAAGDDAPSTGEGAWWHV